VSGVFAIIPVGTLDGAKSRLGAVLDAEERLELARRLARRTIEAAVGSDRIVETIVVTPDDVVRDMALDSGARPLRQRSGGLNQGLAEARDEAVAGGASAILVLPTDLPAVSTRAIDDVLDTLDGPLPAVTLVSDRHGRGTNALLLAPPDVIDVHFGGDSHDAHVAAAAAAGAAMLELDGPLSIDLDTPDDLLLAEASGEIPESISG
jgi:2-phospho-L-lactate guanylyltransferase